MDKIRFLCGFMGCGKSTVGAALARRSGTELIDLDDYIVAQSGMTIPELFAAYGEEGFRERESEAVRDICSKEDHPVVALGGGAVLREENVCQMRECGEIIFLDTPFPVCLRRISGDRNRPLAANAEEDTLRARYETRRTVYTACADRVIALTGEESPDEIAERICTE